VTGPSRDGSPSGPRDWDAASYDRVSDPQFEWGREVLERLPLRGDEMVLDAGCGSGRVTQLLIDRLPRGRVIAVDAAPSMVEAARAALGDRAEVIEADLLELELPEPVDAVFSTATFHWVLDHDLLFERLHAVLRPVGRLVAQCGGRGNVERFLAVASAAAAEEPFAPHLAGFVGPWHFPSPDATVARLERAGFEAVRCWLDRRVVGLGEPREFLTTVCLGHHLPRLPEELRDRYVEAVLEQLGDPVEIDYVRLNIDATRRA
jgi:trans-aconitate 2-methyltransferase